MWGSYGRGDGLTESQWQNTGEVIGDVDQWSAGVGFAYGGFLPGLMESRQPTFIPGVQDPHDHMAPVEGVDVEGALHEIGAWPWYTALSLFAVAGIVAWLYLKRKRDHVSG